jgi:hypothetical protein
MHHLTSSFSLGLAASLAVASVTALWLSPCRADPAQDAPPTNLAELRAQGPAGLEALRARYRATRTGRPTVDPAWETAWETAIDSVAGQRYASWSGLYWYTDLALAEREAQHLHRPILALRMLGDLRDDRSCANSRLFRATLYANTEVSAFLRDHFVLYWSSERTVPIVTIDFGDGRKLVRTTTGNSAHYVLDDQGNVLDVLPGLYAPSVFRAELTTSVALADQVRGMPDAERIRATVAYHAAAIKATDRAWQRAAGAQYLHGSPVLLGATAIARAQRATMSKMIIEVPDLRAIDAIQPGEVPDDAAAWSAIGQRVWNIYEPARPAAQRAAPRAADDGRRAAPSPLVLDEPSRTLVRALHNAGPLPRLATPAELDMVVARLEQHIVADTALNQFTLRQDIHRHIVQLGETRFAALNGWIYDAVFATPSRDPWLGLLPRTDFTGLPGDGVVMP